jgi:predicted AlkP superfamily phosphohydrolase/phosphomutase/Tfp pilus assembly protein PilF
MNSDKKKKKVLLIGWDAADWKVISPLMDDGRMPYLKKLVETGSSGNICTLHPILSPMLWTSIATGKRPYKHGIYGFYEPTPDRTTVQPITNIQRRTKAVWNILNQNGYQSNVLGWWPSHPTEPINGVMVSDLFFKASPQTGYQRKPPSDSVHPASMLESLGELRFDIKEVMGDEIRAFIPKAGEVDQARDARVSTCARTLCECTSLNNVATELMETTEWDFMAVYFDAIDHFSHAFMRYHPPRRPFISERDFELYNNVITMAYAYHDLMLGRLLYLAGDDVTVILMSDHGFHPDHLRPDYVPYEPAGPAIEHRDLGIFVINGEGIKQDHLLYGLSLLDVTPTVLTLFGLPVGEDMDGRVISDAFNVEPDVQSIESWDKVEGDHGGHPPDRKLSDAQSKQAIQQLVDLGYIEAPTGDDDETVRKSEVELNYNLARSYLDANRHQDAVTILEKLTQENPSEYRIAVQLAMCYRHLGRVKDLEALIKMIRARRLTEARIAQKRLQRYNEIIKERRELIAQQRAKESKDKDKDSEQDVDPEKIALEDLLDKEEQTEYRTISSRAELKAYTLDFLEGYALVAQGKSEEGIKALDKATKNAPTKPGLYTMLGEAYISANQVDSAERTFQKALELDENNPQALLGLAITHMFHKDYKAALEFAKASVGKMYFNPIGHKTVGEAYARMGKPRRAANELKIAIKQNANYEEAHLLLAEVYEKLDDQAQATEHTEWAEAARDLFATAEAAQSVENEQSQSTVPVVPDYEDDQKPILPDQTSQQRAIGNLLPTISAQPWRVQHAAKDEQEDFVTIVTGLPRSGTSMMMQMLQAGGIMPMTDNKRSADVDNPQGYLELDEVKSLATDNRWVFNAIGKSLKVVVQLLKYLPADLSYRFIFMVRDLDEVVKSQEKMLDRLELEGSGDLSSANLKEIFAKQVAEAQGLIHRSGSPGLALRYDEIIKNPEKASKAVQRLIGKDLPLKQMAASVKSELYRNRR